MELLLVNPNTSEHITARMVEAARSAVGPDVRVRGATAGFGPAVIGTRAEVAIAGHGALDVAARESAGCDAVVLGVSIDCGLSALRELLPVPVTAMTESGLACAGMLGSRIGLLTLGARVLPLYRELVASYGWDRRMVSWRAPELPGAFAPSASPAPALLDALAAEVDDMVARDGAEAVLLSGAVLAGCAAPLRDRVAVPLVDCAAAAALQAVALVRLGAAKARTGSLAFPAGRASSGLSAPLAARLSPAGPGSVR